MPKKEIFKDIDKFLEFYKFHRPETVYLVKNRDRYTEVMDAIRTIYTLAYESNPDGTSISTSPDELTGTSLCIEIISNLVVFEDIKNFCTALSKASNLEICVKSNGKALIGIVFQDVYDLAPPSKK